MGTKQATAAAVQPNAGQAALEKIIDETRAQEGIEPAGIERARVHEAMNAQMAKIGPKPLGAVAAVGAPPRRVLTVDRCETASARRNHWAIDVQHGTSLEDILDPRYWTNLGNLFKPWDRLECRWEDGSAIADLVVEDRGARYAKVAILFYVPLQVADPEGAPLPQGYSIDYKGPHTQWVVIRDGQMLRDKFSNRSTAQGWLNDHLRVVSR